MCLSFLIKKYFYKRLAIDSSTLYCAKIECEYPRDAEEALYRLDRQRLFGKEIEVEFARGDRKTPSEMRSRDSERRYVSRYERRYDDYDRRYERDRRSRSRERRRRSKVREVSYSRSKTRSRSRSGSHRGNKSVSRDRSRSPIERSASIQRRSPQTNGSAHSRSPTPNN